MTLDHIDQVHMQVGDVFEIHTPGGGAYLGSCNRYAGVATTLVLSQWCFNA
jgi:N-methylhydantoinase B/oxoprolinase/acetone carboxylase alpha subunit